MLAPVLTLVLVVLLVPAPAHLLRRASAKVRGQQEARQLVQLVQLVLLVHLVELGGGHYPSLPRAQPLRWRETIPAAGKHVE